MLKKESKNLLKGLEMRGLGNSWNLGFVLGTIAVLWLLCGAPSIALGGTSSSVSTYDCVFDCLERKFSNLFSPRKSSRWAGEIYYRDYPNLYPCVYKDYLYFWTLQNNQWGWHQQDGSTYMVPISTWAEPCGCYDQSTGEGGSSSESNYSSSLQHINNLHYLRGDQVERIESVEISDQCVVSIDSVPLPGASMPYYKYVNGVKVFYNEELIFYIFIYVPVSFEGTVCKVNYKPRRYTNGERFQERDEYKHVCYNRSDIHRGGMDAVSNRALLLIQHDIMLSRK